MKKSEMLDLPGIGTPLPYGNVLPLIDGSEIPEIPVLDGLSVPKIGETIGEVGIGPAWVREMSIARADDWDRMCDSYRISIRIAPEKNWHRSEVRFEKFAVMFYLPYGTPTPGLNALALLMQGINKNE